MPRENVATTAPPLMLRASLLALSALLAAASVRAQTIGGPLVAPISRTIRPPTPVNGANLLGVETGRAASAGDTSRAALRSLYSASTPLGAAEDRGPGVWKYVAMGALIGGTIAGGYVAYRARDCGRRDACWFVEYYIAGAFGLGAVVGGLVGSMVYAERYWSEER